MKRLKVSLGILLLGLQMLEATTFVKTFDVADYQMNVAGGVLAITSAGNAFYGEEATNPRVPYLSYDVLIGPSDTIVGYSVQCTKTLLYQNVSIEAVGEAVPTDPTAAHAAAVPTLVAGSNQSAIYSGMSVVGGYRLASFKLSPFEYDAASHKIYFISEMQITLQTAQTSGSVIMERSDVRTMIAGIVANPDALETLYPIAQTMGEPSEADRIDYLIITNDELKPAFEHLAKWKNRKGIKTEIKTLASIYATPSYAASTNQLKIKKCIRDYAMNKGLKWVLLGGDETIVPAQMCYIHSGSYTETTPTDLFYACFDGDFGWDANGNGVIGEVGDGVEMVPLVYVTRALVRTYAQAFDFHNKVYIYERMPRRTDYVRKVLMAGAQLSSLSYFPIDGKSDAHMRSDYLYDKYIQPHWAVGEKSTLYDTGSSLGSGYTLTAAHLQEQINSGYHFVHVMSHGSATAWSMGSASNYTTAHAAAQTNGSTAIVVSTACRINGFDLAEPCLSEAFMRGTHGALAYFASSRYGWYYPDKDIRMGPSDYYSIKFFESLFRDQTPDVSSSFGEVAARAKISRIGSCKTDGADRWLQFAINAIGDAAMPIYTDNPKDFVDANIVERGTTVKVTTGGVLGCRITLTRQDNPLMYMVSVADTARYTFENVDFPYYITITKPNYVPLGFHYMQRPDISVQNQTYSSEQEIQGKNVFIGRNVTSLTAEGNVILQPGADVKVKCGRKTVLKSGVQIRQGARFKVVHEP